MSRISSCFLSFFLLLLIVLCDYYSTVPVDGVTRDETGILFFEGFESRVAEKVRLYKRYSRVGLRLLFSCHVKETRLNSGNSSAVLEYSDESVWL